MTHIGARQKDEPLYDYDETGDMISVRGNGSALSSD
jgi:hypothetical protein